MSRRQNIGLYEPLTLYDAPDAGGATDAAGAPKKRSAGHDATLVAEFEGHIKRRSAESAARAGLSANRQHAYLECYDDDDITERRMVYQTSTGHWWEITSAERAETYGGVTMTATLRRSA